MTDDVTFHDEIEGYCGRLSYRPEEVAAVHVSSRADRYDVEVHRWGAERRLVWEGRDLAGSYVAPPPDADANGCGWPVGVEVPIGDDWSSGFYLVTLRAASGPPGRRESHAGFVVRPDPTEPSAGAGPAPSMVLVLATNTWNAYNTWGGRSLYTGGREVSFRRPFGRGTLCRPEVERDDRKARPVRWGEEADVEGDAFQAYRMANGYPAAIGSTGWFAHERRFVEWAEGRGYRFDYAVSSDLDDDPTALDGYQVMVSVGHDEYWSAPQRNAVEAHVARGGNLASFSGNTMFWQVRLEARGDGGGGRAGGDVAGGGGDTMVCHKYTAHVTDPVVADGRPEDMTGMWCDPMVGRPEWSVLGAGSAFGLYNRFGRAVARGSGAFTVYRHDHWLLAGTGLGYGDLLGAADGVVGYETLGCRLDFDDLQLPVARPVDGMPADVEVVAFAPSSNLAVGEYPASISALSDQGDLEFIAERVFGGGDEVARAKARYGNSVLLVCRPFDGGGEVVTVGTTDWVFGLAGDAAVGRVTANVIDRLTNPF
ncbi:MAG: N,N-dimethylformamidase beta subunit family domain-containing protein [Acidimicrobiales bacterium]